MHNAHQLALDDESIRMIKNRFDETLVSALKTIPVILSMTVQFAVGQNALNVAWSSWLRSDVRVRTDFS